MCNDCQSVSRVCDSMQLNSSICLIVDYKNHPFLFYFQFHIFFLKMGIYFHRNMLDVLTILVQLSAIAASTHECYSAHTCHHVDMEGISPFFREFQRPGQYSCLAYCIQDPNCAAVTHDPTLDICRLHFEADDIACLQLLPATRKSLWIINEYTHHHSRCYVVTNLRHVLNKSLIIIQW